MCITRYVVNTGMLTADNNKLHIYYVLLDSVEIYMVSHVENSGRHPFPLIYTFNNYQLSHTVPYYIRVAYLTPLKFQCWLVTISLWQLANAI